MKTENRIAKENPFRVGDTVYTIWNDFSVAVSEAADVVQVNEHYCVIQHGNCRCSQPFTTLSFTPFNVFTGGFSHDRPLPDIEIDTPVYVRGINKRLWELRRFGKWKDGRIYCWDRQLKSTDEDAELFLWAEWSLTNPLETN